MIVEQTLVFAAAPAVLWPWLSEPEQLARWISDAQRFEARPARPLAPRSAPVGHLPPRAPRRELALRARGLPNDLEVALRFTLHEQGGGTRLVLRAETELTGLMIFAEKLIASKAQAKLAAWAGNLRGLVAPRHPRGVP